MPSIPASKGSLSIKSEDTPCACELVWSCFARFAFLQSSISLWSHGRSDFFPAIFFSFLRLIRKLKTEECRNVKRKKKIKLSGNLVRLYKRLYKKRIPYRLCYAGRVSALPRLSIVKSQEIWKNHMEGA